MKRNPDRVYFSITQDELWSAYQRGGVTGLLAGLGGLVMGLWSAGWPWLVIPLGVAFLVASWASIALFARWVWAFVEAGIEEEREVFAAEHLR